VLAVRGRNSSGGFHVFELVISGRIFISPVEGECWQSADVKSSRWKQFQDSIFGRIFTA
jgi:hypothetical protein